VTLITSLILGSSFPIIRHGSFETGYKLWQKSASYDLHSDKTDLDLYNGEKAGIYED